MDSALPYNPLRDFPRLQNLPPRPPTTALGNIPPKSSLPHTRFSTLSHLPPRPNTPASISQRQDDEIQKPANRNDQRSNKSCLKVGGTSAVEKQSELRDLQPITSSLDQSSKTSQILQSPHQTLVDEKSSRMKITEDQLPRNKSLGISSNSDGLGGPRPPVGCLVEARGPGTAHGSALETALVSENSKMSASGVQCEPIKHQETAVSHLTNGQSDLTVQSQTISQFSCEKSQECAEGARPESPNRPDVSSSIASGSSVPRASNPPAMSQSQCSDAQIRNGSAVPNSRTTFSARPQAQVPQKSVSSSRDHQQMSQPADEINELEGSSRPPSRPVSDDRKHRKRSYEYVAREVSCHDSDQAPENIIVDAQTKEQNEAQHPSKKQKLRCLGTRQPNSEILSAISSNSARLELHDASNERDVSPDEIESNGAWSPSSPRSSSVTPMAEFREFPFSGRFKVTTMAGELHCNLEFTASSTTGHEGISGLLRQCLARAGPQIFVAAQGQPAGSRGSSSRARYTPEEDEEIVRLKEEEELSWTDIETEFPGRSKAALKLRYSKLPKNRRKAHNHSTTKKKGNAGYYTVECISEDRIADDDIIEYRVLWADGNNSWEPFENVKNSEALLSYLKRSRSRDEDSKQVGA